LKRVNIPEVLMLSGKIIVVTGGAGLLGRRFCNVIAEQRGFPVVADLDSAAANRVAEEIKVTGSRAEAVTLDITDSASVDGLISSLHERHGRIDAVVNNAYPRNKNWGRKLEDVTYPDFCENVSLHLGGYFLVAQKFALYFRNHGGGNIVNMASIYGSMTPRFEVYGGTPMTMPVEYAAIKSAVIHLTRYFAQYFKQDGLRCNSLSPGGILDQQPDAFLKQYKHHCGVKGMLQSEDIAGACVFLLSDLSRYVTGQNLVVDDGFSL
jgi:NAD(P)-dependent dehydrogenase (short-subunit alcohol dehydrogenase family)